MHYYGWGSERLDRVVDVYEHALSARFPRARYVVGWDAKLFFEPLWHLPDCVSDFLLTSWPICKLLK